MFAINLTILIITSSYKSFLMCEKRTSAKLCSHSLFTIYNEYLTFHFRISFEAMEALADFSGEDISSETPYGRAKDCLWTGNECEQVKLTVFLRESQEVCYLGKVLC